ncbi:MAG: hypothetical protein RL456_3534, partial [Pseudomonadota bacterium]
QLRVAAGEPLPLRQEQLTLDGHAIEARIYAEDPDRGFLPSTGRLVHLVPPAESEHVRVDTGVEQGDEITPHYDPMIAKLIVRGPDRPTALARMRAALAKYRVVGVANNVEFLQRLVNAPAFVQADLDTALIEREQSVLFPEPQPLPVEAWALAALAELQREARAAAATEGGRPAPWTALDGWRLNSTVRRTLTLRCGDAVQAIGVSYLPGGFELHLGGRALEVRGDIGASGQVHAQIGERRVSAAVVTAGERRQVFFEGRSWPIVRVAALQSGGGGDDQGGGFKAPMPGKVIALLAEPGQRVDKGAPLLVLEAMKMEHTITAPAAGVVRAFHYATGEQVGDGAELVDFQVLAAPPAA